MADLEPQAWMTAGPTRKVMAALHASGPARFVGGCVRDALLGRPLGDIDIATPLTPPRVTRALQAAGLKAVPTGVDHGTVTAIADGQPFEITTLRRDVETDGRRAVVAFTTDWQEDAERRDFRLNALYLNEDGSILDPTGEGVADARAGRIVFVGEPETRIREDYLRILRFFRFYAWYGRGEIDAAGLAACAARREGLKGLSGERVSKEMLKLLAAEDPRPAVRLMAEAGVLGVLLPQAGDLTRLEGLVQIAAAEPLARDPVLRLAALLPADVAAVRAAAGRLRLSNPQRDRLIAAAEGPPVPAAPMTLREARQALYRFGADAFRDRIAVAWGAAGLTAADCEWRGLLSYPDAWAPPAFPITGEEIKAAGVPEGPLHGRVRREVEAWWIDADFPADKAAALERLRAVVEGLE